MGHFRSFKRLYPYLVDKDNVAVQIHDAGIERPVVHVGDVRFERVGKLLQRWTTLFDSPVPRTIIERQSIFRRPVDPRIL